jgi:two-component system sensor histidine kinase KdpD
VRSSESLTATSDLPIRGRLGRILLISTSVLASIVAATAAVAALETAGGIDDASPVYLIAVVVVGAAFGTWPALATAFAAFLVYDVLFTAPRFSLTVDDPRVWLDLLLFLFVAVVVGRLVAVQHRRAEEAEHRSREANSLFALSRMLVTTTSTEDAVPGIARRLASDARLERVWISIGAAGRERVVADTGGDATIPSAAVVATLARRPGDEPARWIRTHAPREAAAGRPGSGEAVEHLRVRIEADGEVLGGLSATRDRALGMPSREETRILALAADQIALSLRRDQVTRIATDLEVSRQGDALKTALIDSVSHDLRTPLASIRATAGGLADPDVEWADQARRDAAAVIDAEAARLDRLVRGILDLGRIDSGALHPELEPHDLASLVEPVVDRLRPILGDREVTLDLDGVGDPVVVDAMLFDVVLTNLLENAANHATGPAPVRVSASAGPGDRVRLVVEDGGPGVPHAELDRVFQRFHRIARPGQGARRGLGIGLSVVKGLTEAMGGAVNAGPSRLGGLAVTIELETATEPRETES